MHCSFDNSAFGWKYAYRKPLRPGLNFSLPKLYIIIIDPHFSGNIQFRIPYLPPDTLVDDVFSTSGERSCNVTGDRWPRRLTAGFFRETYYRR